MRVAAILPCRGRPEQTARNVARLLATAGLVHGSKWRPVHGSEWTLVLAGGYQESGLLPTIAARIVGETGMYPAMCCSREQRLSYWQALALATEANDAPLLVNLANDLLPGAQWLQRAVAAYDRAGGQYRVLGFNDGISSTAHFLIERAWLADMGGWPVWYDHMCGDIEIVERAQAQGVYASLPWAVLYHDHHLTGAPHDGVYAEGEARWAQDQALLARRRSEGWPHAR